MKYKIPILVSEVEERKSGIIKTYSSGYKRRTKSLFPVEQVKKGKKVVE